jgi:hypothetical protein
MEPGNELEQPERKLPGEGPYRTSGTALDPAKHASGNAKPGLSQPCGVSLSKLYAFVLVPLVLTRTVAAACGQTFGET